MIINFSKRFSKYETEGLITSTSIKGQNFWYLQNNNRAFIVADNTKNDIIQKFLMTPALYAKIFAEILNTFKP